MYGTGIRLHRAVWSATIFLAIIGIGVAARMIVYLVPIVAGGYHSPPLATNPRVAQFIALDDLFAPHAMLTLIHIIPGLFFMLLGPLQFSSTLRARHLQWHRWNGRIFVVCGIWLEFQCW